MRSSGRTLRLAARRWPPSTLVRPTASRLAEAFCQSPRAAALEEPLTTRQAAGKIGEAWAFLDAEAREKLGQPLSYRWLAVVIAAAHDVADRVVGKEFWLFNGTRPTPTVTVNAAKVLVSGAPAVTIEDQLFALEVALVTDAAQCPADAERLGAMTSAASEGEIRRALATLDDARAVVMGERNMRMVQEAQAAFEARQAGEMDGSARERPKTFSETVAGMFGGGR